MYKGRNFSGGGGGRFKGSLVEAVLLKPFDSEIATLFKKRGEIDPGGNSAYERGGMLVGNFELNS